MNNLPLSRSVLTDEQASKCTALLSRISNWSDAFHGHPLGDHERRLLTQECLLRYLRASKWAVDDSMKRLEATILWRRERLIEELRPEGSLYGELKTGRLLPLGHDKDRRPCLYYDLSKETPELSDTQLSHLCFVTERTIDLMQPGVESITVIIDLSGASRSSMPSIAKVKAYVSAFQDHNPERLGMVIVPTALPWWFHGLWRIIQYFLDPVVKNKIKFEKNISLYVNEEQLWKKYGGDMGLEPDQAKYWSGLLDEAKKRREQYAERWESAGKRLGESEWYLKGGESDPANESYTGSKEKIHIIEHEGNETAQVI